MSWDDEDFDIPSKAPANVASASWEDEEDDDPILESWDIDEEEVARKKKEEEDKKNKEKAELKKKQEEAKLKKLNAKKGIRGVLDVDELDDDVRKELMKEEALRADLNNTADLFGGLGVSADDALEHPKERLNRAILAAQSKKPVLTKDTPLEEHPLFQPTNKQEYENLRKGVGSALTKLADDSIMNYSSSLAIDLIRDLSVPLSVENLRKVISTLNVAIKDKEKAERLARLKKSGGTATGGAGKKKAKPAARPNVGGGFMKDGLDEMDNYDDFGDDDFM